MNWHGDYVRCEICGAVMKRLGIHVNKKHKMSILDYKDKFPDAPTTNASNTLKRARTTGKPTTTRKAYIDEHNVECLMCGKRFKLLCSHVKRAHGISMNDYRKLFPGEPVASLEVSKRKSEVGKRCAKSTHSLSKDKEAARRKRLSAAAKKQWKDKDARKKLVEAQNTGKRTSEAFRESHAAQLREVRKTKKFKDSVSSALSKTAKEMWQDPQKRKDQRERLSKLQAERTKAGINSWVNHHTRRDNCIHVSPSGKPTTMRSSWEVKLATDLDNLDVAWVYEPKLFPYEWDGATHQYIPDFHLPDYDIYIEVRPSYFTDDKLESKQLAVKNLLILTEENWPFESDNDAQIALLEELANVPQP